LVERFVRIVGCHGRSLASVTPEKYMSKREWRMVKGRRECERQERAEV
jgi:hypothetical protein